MLNFKDFKNKNPKDSFSENEQKKNFQQAENNNLGFSSEQYDEAMNIINKYKNFSEEDLTKEIAASIKKQKENNQFNKENIINQINSLGNFLTLEQQQKMRALIDESDK